MQIKILLKILFSLDLFQNTCTTEPWPTLKNAIELWPTFEITTELWPTLGNTDQVRYTLNSDLPRIRDQQTGLLTCSRFLLWSYWTRAGISFMGSRLPLRLIHRLTVSLGMYCISRGENLYTNSVSVCNKFQYTHQVLVIFYFIQTHKLACISKAGVYTLHGVWNSISYLFWKLTQGPFIVVMLNVMGDDFLKIYKTEAKQQYNQQV